MPRFQAIDEERRRLDVSQKELCLQAGVNQATYVRCKKRLTSPNEKTLDRLANALAIIQAQRRPEAEA